ncbi:MAG: GNAT family N-acetyltransferase [Bacteroidota bacterium]
MIQNSIIYNIKTASAKEIYSHLLKCNDSFIPPLSETINIEEYSNKLFEKSILFEAWDNNILVGCIAAYFNDTFTHNGFITNVSVINEYAGNGIATALLKMCIEYAKNNNIHMILLEVNRNNSSAIFLYEKFGFLCINTKVDILTMNLKINNNK